MMLELFDRLHLLMTGKRATEIMDDPIEEGTPGTGTFSGMTIYAGLDRIPEQIPDMKHPYIVIEPDQDRRNASPIGTEYATINIGCSVLIDGQKGSLVGKSITGEKGILEWLDVVRTAILSDEKLKIGGTLSPLTCNVSEMSTNTFMTADETGIPFSRSFELAITWRLPDWTGQ